MRRRLALLPLLLLPALLPAQVGIGQWRSHLSYHRVNELCLAGEVMYAAAPQGLFSVDLKSLEVEFHDKTTTLNDVGIATLAYDEATRTLVVAYDNANIDLLRDGQTYNISDLKRSSLSGDKSIYRIRFHQRRAYLACAFGIVVLNLDRQEIEDTWYIGPEGAHDAVRDLAFYHDSIVAAMDTCLRAISQEVRFPNIASNWSLYDTLAGCRRLEVWQDSLLRVTGGDIRSLRVCDGRLVVTYPDHIEADGTEYRTVDWLSNMNAHDALLLPNGTLFVAHDWASMVSIKEGAITSYRPSCPASDNVYAFHPFRDRLLLCPGGKSSTHSNAYFTPSIGLFTENHWSNLPADAPIYDILSVSVNPRNTSQMLAAAWGYGIVEYEDGLAVALYDDSNTPALQPYTSGNFHSLRTGAICHDPQGNAWMTVSKTDDGLVRRSKEGDWQSFYTGNMVEDKELDKILYDTVNRLVWFCGQPNRLFVADADGHTAWVDPNQGAKMETSAVTCMAQDHNGQLWFGTNKGLKVISSAAQAFDNGGNGEKSPVNCSNITISNDEFAEYLMAYESVTCLAVDGANRKWVGTAAGGLYLISANGQEELLHFTATNSPLFSNKITAIGIQPQTGEVFIGTPQGTQSYRGTATYASSQPQKEIHVFPNPVEPGYDGPIAVRGFSRNALVHISDAAGHVVFSGTADGGQVVWNGCTLAGQPVASGVYFVFASDEQGKNRAVGKVLIVR